MPSKVQLYVYDVTKGLAAQMSSMLIGQHIDGVWHTAIVCYSREYLFGSGGIDSITPGTTVLGAPDKVVELGETYLTSDVFNEYLFSVGNDQFRPEKYHLFDHNCNTFSNEVAQFLTGKKIPDYILDLPRNIENTPLGSMLRSYMDGMTSSPGHLGSHQSPFLVQPAVVQPAVMQPAVVQPAVVQEETLGERSSGVGEDRQPVVYTYDLAECLTVLRECLTNAEKDLDVIEKYAIAKEEASNIDDHLSNVFDAVKEYKEKNIIGSFLDLVSIAKQHRKKELFKERNGSVLLSRALDTVPDQQADSDVMTSVMKLAANLCSDMESRIILLVTENYAMKNIYETFKSLCLQCLLGSYGTETVDAAISFLYNLCLSKVDDETEIELSSALLHWLNANDHKSVPGRKCVVVLKTWMNSNEQVTELAGMTIEATKLQ